MGSKLLGGYTDRQNPCLISFTLSSSSSSSSCQGFGPLVESFRSHTYRSFFSGLPWFLLPLECSFFIILVICYVAFDLDVSIFSCNPVFCLKLRLYFIPLQCLYLLCDLSKCIQLFSYISSHRPLFLFKDSRQTSS
jgi:hypothetical protein